MANFTPEENKVRCCQDIPPDTLNSGKFLKEWAHKLQWGDLSDSTVMDVGCGINCLKLFQAIFPKFHKVIAIDISTRVITELKNNYFEGKMEYCVADITNRSTLTEWEAKMPKITSFFCLNNLNDQKTAFANIHYLLRPGGEAIILNGLKNPYFECAKFLLAKPKWNKYQNLLEKYSEFHFHYTGLLSFYENILSELDFEIISCVEDLRVITFETEEVFKASKITKDRTITQHLPLNVHDEFKEDYVQALMHVNGRTSEGEFCLRTSTARIIIRRKNL